MKSKKPTQTRKSQPRQKTVLKRESESAPAGVRLNRFISSCGVASRRKSDELIAAGRVSINSKVVTDFSFLVLPQDRVEIDGKRIELEQRELFIFHKPRNVVTTLNDPQGRPSIKDFVKNIESRVYPIGRLDFDVNGLLLLTNDGDLAQQFLHPRFKVPRRYAAIVSGHPNADTLRRMKAGIELEDGVGRVSAVRVVQPRNELLELLGKPAANESIVELEVAVGKKHFVKRILKAAGHPVRRLTRTQFGALTLEGLKPGQMRRVDISSVSKYLRTAG